MPKSTCHSHAPRVSRTSQGLVSLIFLSTTISLSHQASETKQEERRQRIIDVATASRLSEPLTAAEAEVLAEPISAVVSAVQTGKADPVDILRAYGKKALKAHEATNCLTEVMISAALSWARECNRDGSLAGVPVSLKDVSSNLSLAPSTEKPGSSR